MVFIYREYIVGFIIGFILGGNNTMTHPHAESRKRARKRWRQSPKGKAWDRAYLQRPEVKARRKEYYIQRIIKECAV